MKKRKNLLSNKRREAISQLTKNLATFWLTAVPVALFSNFGAEDTVVVPLVGTVFTGSIFALLSVMIHKSEDEEKQKKEEQMHTEIKKGVFHIENAEIKK